MGRWSRFGALSAAVALGFAVTSCGAGGDSDSPGTQVLSMGVVPSDTVEETFNQWNDIIERVEDRTGYEIELFEATDLAAVVESTIAGDLDIIHLGPFGHVIAHQNGARISTVGATAPTSAGTNNASVAVVRDDSPATSLADLKGEDVCFISPSSATGYLFGAAALLDLGIDPESDVNPIFVGDHASAVRTMYDGECAAVFTYRDYGTRIAYEDNPDFAPGSLRVLWQEEVPEAGLAISTDLPEDVQQALREALLELNGTNILAEGDCPDDLIVEPEDGSGTFCGVWPNRGWGLEEKDDSYWEPVRLVCEATEAPACAA